MIIQLKKLIAKYNKIFFSCRRQFALFWAICQMFRCKPETRWNMGMAAGLVRRRT